MPSQEGLSIYHPQSVQDLQKIYISTIAVGIVLPHGPAPSIPAVKYLAPVVNAT
jgi:hypothetical protein